MYAINLGFALYIAKATTITYIVNLWFVVKVPQLLDIKSFTLCFSVNSVKHSISFTYCRVSVGSSCLFFIFMCIDDSCVLSSFLVNGFIPCRTIVPYTYFVSDLCSPDLRVHYEIISWGTMITYVGHKDSGF